MTSHRDWARGPLYRLLMDTFPAYRTTYDVFDVRAFGAEPEIARSHEALYKWLRSGKLTIENARSIVTLANRDDNAARLAAAGRTPPVLTDLLHFL